MWNLAQRLIIGSMLRILRETRPENHVTSDIRILCFVIFARMNKVKSEKLAEFPVALSGKLPECSRFLPN